MKILLTGASGFVGTKLLTELLAEGHVVYCLARCEPKVEHPNCHFIRAELSRHSINHLIPEELDFCFHTASEIQSGEGFEGKMNMLDSNVSGCLVLAEALRDSGCKHVIYCSSISVYPPHKHKIYSECDLPKPMTLYGSTKLFGEYIFNQQLESVTVLRFANIMDSIGLAKKHQPLLFNWCDIAARGQSFKVFEHGNWYRPFVHIDKVVSLMTMLLGDCPKGIFNVGPISSPPVRYYADAIADFYGVSVDYTNDPLAPNVERVDFSKAEASFGTRLDFDIFQFIHTYVTV